MRFVLASLAPLAVLATAPALLLAAAPPPEAAQSAGPFMVFFDYDSAAVTAQSRDVLSRLLAQWRRSGAPYLSVEGHADTGHTVEQSLAISRRRAWAIRDFLVDAGVPGEAIRVRYFGEQRLLVETADEIREPQNRRVEIHLVATPEQRPR